VISLFFGSFPPIDDVAEESTNPSNTFPSVATSTSFANYFPVAEDNHPVDEVPSDDFLEPHEPKMEGLCELLEPHEFKKEGLCELNNDSLLTNDGLWELEFEVSPSCFKATFLCSSFGKPFREFVAKEFTLDCRPYSAAN